MCTNTKCKANCINIFQTTLLVEVCIPLMEQREMVERTSYIALPRCSFFCCFLPFSPSISSRHLTAGSSYPVVKGSLITNLKAIMTEVILLEISLLSSPDLSLFYVILDIFWPEMNFKYQFRNSRIKAREL